MSHLLFDILRSGYVIQFWQSSLSEFSMRIIIEGHGLRTAATITEKDLKDQTVDENQYLKEIIQGLFKEIEGVRKKVDPYVYKSLNNHPIRNS